MSSPMLDEAIQDEATRPPMLDEADLENRLVTRPRTNLLLKSASNHKSENDVAVEIKATFDYEPIKDDAPVTDKGCPRFDLPEKTIQKKAMMKKNEVSSIQHKVVPD